MNNNTFLLTNTDHLKQGIDYVIIDIANKNIFLILFQERVGHGITGKSSSQK